MADVNNLITDNINVWTSAIKKRNSQGRGSNSKVELTGVKKLRELILELAVRGKLVPQDSNDEPASVLLERIAEEKALLVTDKKIKNLKVFPEISDAEKLFELPNGWKYERLGNLTSRLGSGSTPRGGKSAYVESGVIFLRSQNVWNNGLKLDDTAYISDETHLKMLNTHVFPNDVLLNITGASLGRSTIFPTNLVTANVSQHVTVIRLLEQGMCNFVHLGIMSPLVQKLVWGRQVGMAIEGLSKKVLEQFEFPVPPLAEQHRIVAKVDELMALCDQLEQQTEQSLLAHQTLVEVLLNTLTQSVNADDFQQSWQHIADHFDVLFTTEASIDQLKQTILQLAVMGKLVPQKPSDEPASVLLEKIAEEKAQLIKDKKIKKQKPLPAITDEEKPFELQLGWEWCRGESIADFIDPQPSHRTPPKVDGGVSYIGYTDIDHAKGINFDGARKVGVNVFKEHLERYTLKKGDFVFGKIGTLGKPYFLEEPFEYCLSANLILIQPNLNAVVPKFLALYLNSPALYKVMGEQKTNSTHGVFGIKKARLLLIPYPPLPEQQLIVAKVDELMALCDRLKTRLADAQTTQLQLADAVVENALN